MKIIAQFEDSLGKLTVPQFYEELRRKVVTPDNFVCTIPIKDYLRGDTMDRYSHENRGTRITLFIYPNREELKIERGGTSMWIVNNMINYTLVFPVSKNFAVC